MAVSTQWGEPKFVTAFQLPSLPQFFFQQVKPHSWSEPCSNINKLMQGTKNSNPLGLGLSPKKEHHKLNHANGS